MKNKLLLLFVFITNFLAAQTFTNYNQLWGTYVGPQTLQDNSNLYKDNNGNIIFISSLIIHNQTFYNQSVYNYYKDFTFPNSDELMFSNDDSHATYIAKFTPQGEIISAKYLPYAFNKLNFTTTNEVIIKASVNRDDIGTSGTWNPTPIYPSVDRHSMLMKLNENLELQWATYLPEHNYGHLSNNDDILIDNLGNIYSSGTTDLYTGVATPDSFYQNFTYDFVFGRIRKPHNGYIYKLNLSGEIIWSTYYGVSNISSIQLKDNDLFVSFQNVQSVADYFPAITSDAVQQTNTNSVLAKFDASTGRRTYATYFGEDNKLKVNCIVMYENNLYLAGNTEEFLPVHHILV